MKSTGDPVTDFFHSCRIRIDGIAFALPDEVIPLLQQGAILVDLREELETEIRAFGFANIFYLPFSEFDNKCHQLPAGVPLILADSAGIHAKEAIISLKKKGYKDLAGLAGGFADWLKDGYPVKSGKYEPLNGPCPCMIKPQEKK